MVFRAPRYARPGHRSPVSDLQVVGPQVRQPDPSFPSAVPDLLPAVHLVGQKHNAALLCREQDQNARSFGRPRPKRNGLRPCRRAQAVRWSRHCRDVLAVNPACIVAVFDRAPVAPAGSGRDQPAAPIGQTRQHRMSGSRPGAQVQRVVGRDIDDAVLGTLHNRIGVRRTELPNIERTARTASGTGYPRTNLIAPPRRHIAPRLRRR